MVTTALPEVGVKLTVKDQQKYSDALGKAQAQTSAFTNAVGAATTRATAMGVVAGGLLVTGIVGLTGAMAGLVSKTVEVGKEAIMTAARFEELRMVAKMLGQQQGYTGDEVDGFIKAVRKTGIEASTAADIVTQFARYQIDMAKATDIARVAQDAAVLSGSNSTETLQRLMYAIISGQTEVARTAGLNVNFGKSLDEVAKAAGKSIQELTSAERVQANLNAVMEEGAKISGAYTTAMGSASKQIRSLPRLFDDIRVSIGTPFQDGLLKMVQGVTTAVKKFSEAVGEGGKLEPVLMRLGAHFSIIGDVINNVAGPGMDIFIDLLARAGNGIAAFAEKSLYWGANLVSQFAVGMINAANTVLVGAIDFISNMLSYWMAPGSPPKIAPEIDIWGVAAMTEFLHGMTSADFSILGSMSGLIGSAINSLVSSGNLSETAGADMIGNITRAMIQDLSGTSVDVTGMLQGIGLFGGELANLYDLQGKLAGATDRLTLANEKYKRSLEQADKANSDMIRVMNEYNELAKTGASPAVLAAKRKEYELAKSNRKVAIDSARTAEDQVKTAETEQDQLKEKIELQSQVIQQMLALVQAQTRAGSGAGGTDNPVTEALAAMKDMPKVEGNVNAAFENIKNSIKTKLSEAFKPLTDALSGAQFQALKSNFTTLVADARKLWDAIANDPASLSEKITKLLGVVSTSFSAWVDEPQNREMFLHIGSVVGGGIIDGLKSLFTEKSIETITSLGNSLLEAKSALETDILKIAGDIVTGFVTGIIEKITGRDISDKMTTTVGDSIRNWLVFSFEFATGKFYTKIPEYMKNYFDKMRDIGRSIVDGIIQGIGDNAGNLYNSLVNLAMEALNWAQWALDSHSPSRLFSSEVGETIPTGIAEGVQKMAGSVNKSISGLFDNTRAYGADARASNLRAAAGIVNQNSNQNNYNLTMQTSMQPQSVIQSFDVMRVMAGA